MAAFYSVIGLLIQLFIYEIRINGEKHSNSDPVKYPNPMDDPNLHQHILLRILCSISSVMAVYFVFMRHKTKFEFLKNYYSHDYGVVLFYKYKEITSDQLDRYDPHATTMFTPQLFWELLIVAVSPIPYWDMYISRTVVSSDGPTQFYYLMNDYINAFMALRLYLVVRVCINYSVYTDMYSKKLCQMYGFNTDMGFAIKSRLLNHPVKTISMLFVCFVVVYSYLIRIFESPYYRAKNDTKFDNLSTSVWLCIITLTTVGYGDVYAVTPEGKVISACIAISGAFLMALVVTIVTSQVNLDSKQQLALVHMQVSRQAAVTIQKILQYFQLKRRYMVAREIKRFFNHEFDENEFPRCKFVRHLYNSSHKARESLEMAKGNLGKYVSSDEELQRLESA